MENTMNKPVLLVLLLAFGVLTVAAVMQHGYVGIFEHQLQSLAGLQVLADLGIALLLALAWLWRDARQAGRNPWPWLVLTLAAGSFGPLLYLLSARRQAGRGG
jgi:drug/metabolite transporter (DMT)-like permease